MSFQQENFHSTSFYSDSSLKLNQEIYICQILATIKILEGPYIIIILIPTKYFCIRDQKDEIDQFSFSAPKDLKGKLCFPEPNENLPC